MSARTIVPPPRASITSRRPSTEQSRSARPSQAGALRRVGPAHAVVGHLHHHVSVVAHRPYGRPRGRRVLGHVGERLGHDEVGRRLHRLGQPLAGRGLQLHGDRRAMGERLERGVEAAVAEHGRVDAARQLAQLLERRVELGRRRYEQLLRVSGSSSATRVRAIRSFSAIATSRCCAPSWRLRSSRRRSPSAASTPRRRWSRSSSTLARSSASSRSFSRVSVAAAPTAAIRSRSSSQRGVVHDRGHRRSRGPPRPWPRRSPPGRGQPHRLALGVHVLARGRAASRAG